MKFPRPLAAFLLLLTVPPIAAEDPPGKPSAGPPAKETGEAEEDPAKTDFVFGWGPVPADRARPRGGTSEGAPVTLAPPVALPLPGVAAAKDDFERDRAAILALAGNYRVSFHFLESVGLTPEFEADRPYHSWTTERVHLLEDRGTFISLQHTLEMHFREKDGKPPEPSLVKHWRQDWTYQDRDLHVFAGDSTWKRRRPTEAEVAGTWSQTVTGVEDSPRYEVLGRWEHRGNLSAWTSETFWRPLPRREHSARKDYGILEGIHRIVITPTGWLHEQHNWKRVAGGEGEARFLSGEIGLDRYERLEAPALGLAEDYWNRTGPFWATVRQVWAETLAARDEVKLKNKVGGETLYEKMFDYAEGIGVGGAAYDAAEAEGKVRQWIAAHLEATD